MKKVILVLGFCGLVVGPAVAGERWSAETCKHLQEMKAGVRGGPYGPATLQWQLFPVLMAQAEHCGVNTEAEWAGARAAAGRGTPATPPHQSLHCTTTSRALGGSYTDCD